MCYIYSQPGRAETSLSHLPSLSGNKLDYQLLQQAPHYYHFTINSSRTVWPGVWQEEVAWQGPEVAQDHQEVRGQLPPADREGRRGIGEPAWWKNSTIVSSLAERKIVTSTLDSSTPLLAFKKRGLGSPCWKLNLKKSTTPLLKKKKKKKSIN